MLIRPRITISLRTSKYGENMGESFYINGSIPAVGAVPYNKNIIRSSRVKTGIYAISDGIGNGKNVEIAANKTLSVLKKYQSRLDTDSNEVIERELGEYFSNANGIVNTLGTAGPGELAGSSVSLLFINRGVLTAYNVGSSRVYAYQNGRLSQLSVDDRDDGGEKLLQKYIGIMPAAIPLAPNVSRPCPIENGDTFIMCTDGVTDYVSNDKISHIMSLKIPDEKKTQRIISEAISRGAEKSLTVAIVRVGKRRNSQTSKKRRIKSMAIIGGVVLAVVLVFLAAKAISDFKKSVPTSAPSETEVVTTPPPSDEEPMVLVTE